MSFFGFGKRSSSVKTGQPEWDGQAFDFDDERVPLPIRESARKYYEPFCKFFYVDTKEGGEWWLMDDDEELIEAFWLED